MAKNYPNLSKEKKGATIDLEHSADENSNIGEERNNSLQAIKRSEFWIWTALTTFVPIGNHFLV